MSINIKTNKESKSLQLYINGVLTKELSGEEAAMFLKQAKKEEELNGYLFEEEFLTVTENDIIREIENIEKMVGINFILEKNMNFSTGTLLAEIIQTGENEYNKMFKRFRVLLEGIDLRSNFTDEKFFFSRFTNHDLRSCLSEEVKDYIMDTSGFKLYVSDVEVNIYQFFDEENTITFEPEENFD